MTKRPHQRTFADLVQEPTWSETDASRSGKYASRPGGFNAAGEFFDPEGVKLRLVAEEATEDEAQSLIEAGAVVVAERCGCGGSYGDCVPSWVTHHHLLDLRRGPPPCFTERHGAPTWIDVWANDHGTVVFAHGDVSWGSALS